MNESQWNADTGFTSLDSRAPCLKDKWTQTTPLALFHGFALYDEPSSAACIRASGDGHSASHHQARPTEVSDKLTETYSDREAFKHRTPWLD